MIGVEHYKEAERLLVRADDVASEDAESRWISEHDMAAAQVHATLALVAPVSGIAERYQ